MFLIGVFVYLYYLIVSYSAKRYKAVTTVVESDLILGEVTLVLDSNKTLSQESRATMEAKSLTMHVLKTKIVSKADRKLDQASSEEPASCSYIDREAALGRLNSQVKGRPRAKLKFAPNARKLFQGLESERSVWGGCQEDSLRPSPRDP